MAKVQFWVSLGGLVAVALSFFLIPPELRTGLVIGIQIVATLVFFFSTIVAACRADWD